MTHAASFTAGRRRLTGIGIGAVVLASMVMPAPRAFGASITVNCATQDLQQEIDAAPAGSTLLIAGTCVGPFSVDKALTLKGNPAATLDGNDLGTTLTITGSSPVRLVSLTITGGYATGARGGGIRREGGPLTLNGVSVHGNVVIGGGANPIVVGGGISSLGSLTLMDSSVTNNLAIATGSDSAVAAGGGIHSRGGLTLVRTTVSANRAVASSSLARADAGPGGISAATATLTDSHVDGNRVTALCEGECEAAEAQAGGLRVLLGQATIRRSTVDDNRVTARGSGPARATGGGLHGLGSTVTVLDSSISGNRTTATSSEGSADAGGGAVILEDGGVDPAQLTLVRSRVTWSIVTATGSGAHASGGGISGGGSQVSVTSSSISFNTATAEGGAGGATARGGGIFQAMASSSTSVDRSTVDSNQANASSIGSTAAGGGIHTPGRLVLLRSTVSRNLADAFGLLGALALGGGIDLPAPGADHLLRISTINSNIVRGESDGFDAEATGGGIEVAAGVAAPRLVAVTVARNTATGDSDAQVAGGGIDVSGGAVVLKQSILALNTAPTGPNCSGPVTSEGHNLLGTPTGCTFGAVGSDKLNTDPKLGTLADNGGPTRTLALLAGSPAIDAIPAAVCASTGDQRGTTRPQGPGCDIGAFERAV